MFARDSYDCLQYGKPGLAPGFSVFAVGSTSGLWKVDAEGQACADTDVALAIVYAVREIRLQVVDLDWP